MIKIKNNKFVYPILVPALVLLILFSFIPLVYGLGISFFDYNPANISNHFIGIENYIKMFSDPEFFKAFINTVLFSLVAVSLNILLSLSLANLISSIPLRSLRTLFRVLIFIPCIAPVVGTSMIWKHGILGTRGGLLNNILGLFGFKPVNWMITEGPLMGLIILFTLWSDIGYNIILFTSAIEGIPRDIEEAAAMDGAGSFKRFITIKFPLIGRTFAFVAIMTVIDYMQMFVQFSIFAPTGGQNNAAMVLTNYVYRTAFTSYDMGYASTIASALFFLIFIVTLIQNKLTKTNWSYD